jgi:Cu/Ag efflux protein CusF
MIKRIVLAAALALPLAGLVVGCKKPAPAPAAEVKTYSSIGVIEGFQSEGKVIILKHQKIEGFMDAMTMGFELKDAALGKGFNKGDKVAFSLEVNENGPLVSALKKQ